MCCGQTLLKPLHAAKSNTTTSNQLLVTHLQNFSSCLPACCNCQRAKHWGCTLRGHLQGATSWWLPSSAASSRQIQHISLSPPCAACRTTEHKRAGGCQQLQGVDGACLLNVSSEALIDCCWYLKPAWTIGSDSCAAVRSGCCFVPHANNRSRQLLWSVLTIVPDPSKSLHPARKLRPVVSSTG